MLSTPPAFMYSRSSLVSEVCEAIQKNLGRVVLDASGVPVVDSIGLEALVDVNAEMYQSGRSLKLCSLNQTVRQVLELTGLSPQFEHFEDANSAVRSFL